MPDSEQILTGGNTARSVVRIGNTVRKPATPATPAVHALLAHLREAGCTSVPAPLGMDEQERQVLEYIPGSLWGDTNTHSAEELQHVGSIIRHLHDPASTFQSPSGPQWDLRNGYPPGELICHNDLAPWNLVCSQPDGERPCAGAEPVVHAQCERRWVFIDWDASAPSSRLWDLAWSCLSFPQFAVDCDMLAATAAMHALLSGYRLSRAQLPELLRLMTARARAEYDLIVQGALTTSEPYAKLHAEGHHLFWGPLSTYIAQQAGALQGLLVSLDRD